MGVSGATSPRRQRRPREPQTEEYRVRDVVMDRIAEFIDKSIGPGGQWIDCFANAATAQFPRWWPQAEAEDWSAAVSALGEPPVQPVERLRQASGRGQGGSRVFAARLGAGVPPHPAGSERAMGYIPAGAAIFEMSNGVRCPPTKWGMWLLVLGRVRQLQPPTRRYEGIRILPLNRPGELLAASRARSKTSCIEEVTAEGQRAAPEGRGAWAAQHQGGKTEPQPPADTGAALGGRVPPRRPKMLDLFSGTGSVGEVFRRHGYEVISMDNRAAAKPDILVDIRDWNFRQQFAPGEFDVIAAGVPCLEYSTALTTRPRKLEEADALVEKTLEVIDYLQPRLWWVENPRNGLLRRRPVMAGRPWVDVDYCCFSRWGYQKPTRIWGSPEVVARGDVLCDGRNCANLLDIDTKKEWHRRPHRQRLGGDRTRFTTRDKYRMPPKLVEYLAGFEDTHCTETSDSEPHFLSSESSSGSSSSCSPS